MSASEPTTDQLAPLGLPSAIRLQASKLLRAISSAATLEDALRAADRAEGFALGIETVRALNPGDVEELYLVFDRAYQARHSELDAYTPCC
ncbi:hypothetical protein M5G27_27920 [Pseudomonas shahriarae]|uniref:Uncharacterized protein n=1 Tax=Pseudomonas shahriarae TaxID=2745512 RepID=A0A9X4C7G4_9PSED|nr:MULTISPECIES: hypothetical protein [Pseudomonas]MDD1011303.1 hypothetical protein [Pseudomonas shahriarae]